MLIWGTKGKVKERERGIFYCPNCQQRRQYVLYELGKYFSLYFIAIFQTNKIAEYVECTACAMQFKLSVLNHNPEDDVKALISKICGFLEKGMPAHIIVQHLLESGWEKEKAAKLVYLALDGSYIQCPDCEAVFSNNIDHCSQCGKKLM